MAGRPVPVAPVTYFDPAVPRPFRRYPCGCVGMPLGPEIERGPTERDRSRNVHQCVLVLHDACEGQGTPTVYIRWTVVRWLDSPNLNAKLADLSVEEAWPYVDGARALLEDGERFRQLRSLLGVAR